MGITDVGSGTDVGAAAGIVDRADWGGGGPPAGFWISQRAGSTK